MSVELTVCEGCHRHVRAGDPRCPFCAAPREPRGSAARVAAACFAVAAGLSLQACYGGPPRPRAYVDGQHRPGGATAPMAVDPPTRSK